MKATTFLLTCVFAISFTGCEKIKRIEVVARRPARPVEQPEITKEKADEMAKKMVEEEFNKIKDEQREAKQSSASHPIPKRVDKVPKESQPPTPTSKDEPR
jgi:hypothetical protein